MGTAQFSAATCVANTSIVCGESDCVSKMPGTFVARFLFFVLALIAASLPSAVRAQSIAQTLGAGLVATAIEKSLFGTSIHLHSLGVLTGDSTHAANASSIKLPSELAGAPGRRTYFTLPDTSTVLLGRRYGYYVDHVRSTGVFVTAATDSFTISITLAAPGPALVGTCVKLKVPIAPCTTLGDSVLPAIDWREARIDIVAKPVVFERSLSFDVESVTIGGVFDVGKACEWPLIGPRLCALVNGQSQRLRQKVADQVRMALNDREVRRTIAQGVRQYLDQTLGEPLLGIRSVSMRDAILVVTLSLGR